MAGLDQIQCRLDPGSYLGEISALAFLPLPPHLSPFPLLLAGSGSELLVYDIKKGTLLRSFHVFEGIRVHGISLRPVEPEDDGFSIAVYGERRVKLLALRLDGEMGVDVKFVGRLCRFDHWVLDACFLKEDNHLAVGLSDNSVAFWDMDEPDVFLRVKSSERCLLYSMRIWGNSIEALRVASGTIYNEIIVWELHSQDLLTCSAYSMDFISQCTPEHDRIQYGRRYVPIHLNRLIGHEGSIFRMSWSSDGSKLISVSDDRSSRIWTISGLNQACDYLRETSSNHLSLDLVLFGHNARIWDCCISDPIVITAGEDCTCRVWGMDGKQHSIIKEHIGRGIWRCLYDPASNLLITAGFDSAIKVHLLRPSSLGDMSVHTVSDENQSQSFIISAPKVSNLMDSKSEYVRCIRFARENDLYVATNNGYLYHIQLSYLGNPTWTELALASKEAPIICMDLMSTKSSTEDIIAVGDGKGNATVIRVACDGISITQKPAVSSMWSAEKERQLLGIHWCKSLGRNYLFTADPRGMLKLWSLRDVLNSDADSIIVDPEVSLIAVFTSSIGARIMCLHTSIEDEVLICGDLRGNLIIYPLSKGLILAKPSKTVEKVSVLSQFKGAHGISCVTSILISMSNLHQVEAHTTGRDGCICHFRYNKSSQILAFVGMKQVKELTMIQAVPTKSTSEENLSQGNYAVGFLSADFIIWNLTNESKTVQVPCGGWRRPYSYYLGDVPEYQNCFAYLKDNNIHIHRVWVPVQPKQLLHRMLHIQYHGRETHSVRFISSGLQTSALGSRSSWLATGCEDGTVRVTRYIYVGSESWCESKLLGEHVGGSAVRSIFIVSKIYTFAARANWNSNHALADGKNDELLLISVGAKQVLTCWLLQETGVEMEKLHLNSVNVDCENLYSPTATCSSISFEWLSTHMPPKFSGNLWKLKKKQENTKKVSGLIMKSCFCGADSVECQCRNLNSTLVDQHENDWRYLAVIAFLVKHADTRLKVCFVVVACSDATLMLRALLLPLRLWFDVAALVSESSPVLALQHLVIPGSVQTKDDDSTRNAYFLISGSTDGSITFWDLTETIESFLGKTLESRLETLTDSQRRPQTGRGSQGGRLWRSSMNQPSGKSAGSSLIGAEVSNNSDEQNSRTVSFDASLSRGTESASSQACIDQTISNISFEIREIRPFYVLDSVHQSGVNCLHVSERTGCFQSESDMSYCILSGGDDEAVHYLAFDLTSLTTKHDSHGSRPADCTNHMQAGEFCKGSGSNFIEKCAHLSMHRNQYHLRLLNRDTVVSAHSSAVKGIWTDGIWAFSTGLDQRIRCWKIGPHGKLTEHAHLITCVPEPEALDAINCDSSGRYQIAVAGRGMQMVDFYASA